MAGMKLYVRLTDASGSRTLRLVPLGLYFAFSEPDVKLDRFNNLHVLHQTDAKKFTYCVIDTLGQILERQTYQYTNERPFLRADADGRSGGGRGRAGDFGQRSSAAAKAEPAAPAAAGEFSRQQAVKWRSGGLGGVEAQAEAGFFAVGHGAVDHAGFDGLVKGGTEEAQGGGGFVLFPGAEQFGESPLQIVQAGFDAVILQLLARAVAHAASG